MVKSSKLSSSSRPITSVPSSKSLIMSARFTDIPPSPALSTKVSAPSPPSSISLPVPPSRRSSSAPPYSESLPDPPYNLSMPAPW